MAPEYSKSPLVKKLAIKPKTRITVVNAPEGYREMLGELPSETSFEDNFEGTFDWIQVFVKTQTELDAQLPKMKEKLAANGILWVTFPRDKKATDLNRNAMFPVKENHALDTVSNAVVNDDWTAYRMKHWVG